MSWEYLNMEPKTPKKQLKFGKEAKELILEGVDIISAAVSATLGPRGHNVAIDRKWGAPQVVHDGVTVAKEVDLPNPFVNMGAQLTKEAASRTNDAAGDGTTTATILVQSIAREAYKAISAGNNSMMIRRGIEKATAAVMDELKKMAKEIKTPAETQYIAMVSAQDEEIGKMVAKTMERLGKDGVVTVDESKGASIEVDFKEGMEFDRGYISPYFITKPATQETILEEPYILITDKRIAALQTDFLPFLEMFMKNGANKTLLIIAEDVSGESLATLVVNKLRGNIQVAAVKAPGFGDRQKDVLEDIAILTGGTVISKDLNTKWENVTVDMLGRCGRVNVVKDATLIVDGKGDKDKLKERIESITAEKKKATNEFDKEKLEERLAKLTTGIAIINVGANSEAEMREKKERCIDAISATKAALDEGIVPGGETALIRASGVLRELKGATDEETVGIRIVQKACEAPFIILMDNSGFNAGRMLQQLEGTKSPIGVDVIDGALKDLLKAGIIDPVKVTRSALQNAVSTAIMITTTNVLITDIIEPPNPTKGE